MAIARVRVRAQPFRQFLARKIDHHRIDKDQIRLIPPRRYEAFFAGGCLQDLVPLPSQALRKVVRLGSPPVNDEDLPVAPTSCSGFHGRHEIAQSRPRENVPRAVGFIFKLLTETGNADPENLLVRLVFGPPDTG
jgi:hypothetical protein